MNIAVLYDYFNQFGGGERVTKVITELFPDADIFALLYDEEKTRGMFKGRKIHTSIIDCAFVRKHHRTFIPFMPFATYTVRSPKKYDLVISSTAGYAKGFPIHGSYHISYCHSPLRYAWEIDYLKNLSLTPHLMTKDLLRPIVHLFRKWDRNAARRVNFFIANSHFIAQKINTYYGRDAEVVYPPVDQNVFYFQENVKRDDFYLMVGRLLYYKGFDIGIKAFNRVKKKLVIIGRGPEEKKLRELANPTYITFVPYISDEKLMEYYNRARALVFPQIEDFGLVAAEAQSCGLPVITFSNGGGSEIVYDGKTGVHFSEQTIDGLIDAIQNFEKKTFDRKEIAMYAKRFSEERFKKEFLAMIRKSGFLHEI